MDIFKEEKRIKELEKKIDEMKKHVEEEISETRKRVREDMGEIDDSFRMLKEIIVRLHREREELGHDRDFLMEKHKDFLRKMPAEKGISREEPEPAIPADESKEEDVMKGLGDLMKTGSAEEKQAESEKTPIDELFDLISQKGIVSIKYAADRFNVHEAQIEEWAGILQDHGMIEIHYPVFGKPELKKVS